MKLSRKYYLKQQGEKYIVMKLNDSPSRVIELNDTGAFIFQKFLEKDRTIDEVAYLMSLEYKADLNDLRADVAEFVEALKARNFEME